MMPSSSSVSLSSSRSMRHTRSSVAAAAEDVLDDNCVHYCRKEFENVNKQLCIKNALKWVNA